MQTRERIPRPNREVLRTTNQKRIRFRDVAAACEATGLHLAAGAFLGIYEEQYGHCGCPVAVLYVARRGYPIALDGSGTKWEPETECVESWGIGRYGLSYVTGFMAGFDYTADPRAGAHDATNRNNLFTAGYRDGAAVFHRANRAGLIGEAAS